MSISTAKCLILILLIGSWIYIISFHRISSPAEVIEMINLSLSGPLANESRCNAFNQSHKKCFANIYFIGASKSGTTSMFEYLISHPDLHAVERRVPITIYNNNLYQKNGNSSRKHNEIHRFDRSQYKYSNTYIERLHELSSSPPLALTTASPFIMHYTPNYLYAPSVPFELKDMYRTILEFNHSNNSNRMIFIVMLRDPIARAFSSYWFKNSKLFDLGNKDKGDLNDFELRMNYEFKLRSTYEKCIGFSTSDTWQHYLNISKEKYFNKLNECYHMENMGSDGNEDVDIRENNQVNLKNKLRNNPNNNIDNNTSLSTSDLFRSKHLGKHHILKGIYIDQLYRWFYNFPPTWKSNSKLGRSQYKYCFIFYEHFVKSHEDTVLNLYRCIGLDRDSIDNNTGNKNTNKNVRRSIHQLGTPNSRGSGLGLGSMNKNIQYESLKHDIINYNLYYQERLRYVHENASTNLQFNRIQSRLQAFYEPYNKQLYDLLQQLKT